MQQPRQGQWCWGQSAPNQALRPPSASVNGASSTTPWVKLHRLSYRTNGAHGGERGVPYSLSTVVLPVPVDQ